MTDESMVRMQLNYALLLKDEVARNLKKADEERGKERKEKAKELTTLAAAIEWALSSAIPRHLIFPFDDLYRAAENDMQLYTVLSQAMGSQETLEMAAEMRGLKD